MTKLSYLSLIVMSFLVSTAFHQAHANDDFGIEDENLFAVPPAVATVLRAYVRQTDYKDCAQGEFIGIAVDLQGSGRKLDWIAKTANGCAWGVATAKIWILKNEKGRYRVVLDIGGQAVILSNSMTHGLRDITMPSGTAGHYSDTLLKFDGSSYKIFKSCSIDLQNPEVIKKHPDSQCHIK
ncbi:hypothetical protein [Duganella levis]|uniref:Uncharacterized protein n=1 Tax=Duganella levis TaxID=2692169 RepID=A0ABW9W8I4_9BURK|nr:hypothetical protein [Duganella levis]MYN30288.1 hypothetical protein [Duganella levis]